MLKRFAVLMTVAVLGTPLLAVGATSAPAGADITNTLTVQAHDFAYTLDGHLRPGQAQITFENKGKEAHIMAIFKLKAGKTLKDVKKALKSQDQSAFNKVTSDPNGAYGYPFFLTPRGAATSTTDLFTAGNYVMLCFISDAHGTPHFAKGMLQIFKIAGKPVKSQPVKSDGTVVVTDTTIQPPPSPASGDMTLKVENQGTAVHSYAIFKINGDATPQDVNTFFDKTYQGGPFPADAPGQVLSGVGDFPAGKSVYLTWKNLPPGHYGYASISGDSEAPGGDDFAKGLYGEFDIQ